MPSKEYMKEYRRRNNPKLREKTELANKNKKRCSKCNIIKPFKKYTPQKAGYMGLKAQCKKCDNKYDKQYQLENNIRSERDKTDKAKKYRKNYIKENIEWWRDYERRYRRNRRKDDMFFKIKGNLSARFSDIINERINHDSTVSLLGCSREEFLLHLEKQFNSDMNWSNYGLMGWHVDHIIPISSFDLENVEEVKKACHYTNLQPLWCGDNWKKGNKKQKL
jgi:hypothetical protein